MTPHSDRITELLDRSKSEKDCSFVSCFATSIDFCMLLQEFKIWLQYVKTAPDITSFGLPSWFRRDAFGAEPFHETDDTTTFVSLSQHFNIGWFALLCGYVTIPLLQCQHSFYKSIESQKHGTSWGQQLSTKLWNLTRALWLHQNSILHCRV